MPIDKHASGVEAPETDLPRLLEKALAIAREYKYWLWLTPAVFLVLGLAKLSVAPPEWEASVLLTMFRPCEEAPGSPCESYELAEPPEALAARADSPAFREAVMVSAGLEPAGREAVLYARTQSVHYEAPLSFVEVRVRGYTRAGAVKLASAAAGELARTSAGAAAGHISALKLQLAGAKAAAAQAGKRLQSAEMNTAVFRESRRGINTVYPRSYLWVIGAGLLGAILGFVVPLMLHLLRPPRRPIALPDLNGAAKFVILLAILFSPVNGAIEYLYTLGLDLKGVMGGKLMWLQKGFKDGMLVLVLLMTLAAMLKGARARLNHIYIALLAAVALLFLLTLAQAPIFALIGARTLLPLLLFITAAVFLHENDLKAISLALIAVAAVAVPLALIQGAFGVTIYDFNENGRMLGRFAARIFSVFVMPGSFGIFLLTFIMFAALSGFRRAPLMIAVAAGFIILTGSGMSLVGLLLFGVIRTFGRIQSERARRLLLTGGAAALPVFAFLGYYLIPVITGRASVWNSPLARLEMMVSHFRDSSLITLLKGDGLGYCTNAALNLLPYGSEIFKRASVPDSLYLSLFSQVGLIGAGLFIALNIQVYLRSNCRYRDMIPVLMFTGLTMNLLELFPVNWLYMLLLGVCAKTAGQEKGGAGA